MEDEEEGRLMYQGKMGEDWRDSKWHLHRIDGPAVTYPNGLNCWYKHGFLHRDDGPARIWPSTGLEEWWKNGERYEPSAHDLILWKMKKKES